MQKTFPVRITHYAHDGAGVGVFEGQEVRVHGMLVGEEGIVDASRRHGLILGVLRELTSASPSRKSPDELHFLSCSPWQVMEYPEQARAKHELLSRLFSYYDHAPKPSFVSADKFYGYRTKVEFSFTDRNGELARPLALAYHERGGGAVRLPLEDGCLLVSDSMNKVALLLTDQLRTLGMTTKELKTLVLRESKSTGHILAILYVKSETCPTLSLEGMPLVSGLLVYHSTHKSPASVPTRHLYTIGADTLTERILGMDVTYSSDSFFQNNIPMFEAAVTEMRRSVAPDSDVLELYAGVGTIGLLLAEDAKRVHGIEIIPGAVTSAKENAKRAHLEHYVAECIPAEKMDARLFVGRDVVVLDPPRAGLHPKVIGMIESTPPPCILYLSCNPETQARDYALLESRYQIERIVGFDFYPNTPHLESLLVLKLKTT